ncbi:4-hydroxythreonine-4-phosphate dehydrogenase PdxA [Candidatus Pelagibacter sp.]|nr:4-hydroxythreonine-4-phosphate dehydrogenase PdxA [Candidatus Pelagibacter sp.]
MKNKPTIIVAGEPNSIFLEIFFKSIKLRKYKNPLVLICSLKLLRLQMKKLKFKKDIRILNPSNINLYDLNNNSINLVDITYKSNSTFEKISNKSNIYIKNSFEVAFKIIKSGVTSKLINGPISKKNFLNKKFLGLTEYIADKFLIKKNAMLIYNKNLSVCPVTTHLPLKLVSRNINKKIIFEKVSLIDNFYKKNLGIKARIGVLGLNPHCESVEKYDEDERILRPAIKSLVKLGFNVSGPYPADTIFLKKNRDQFDVILGMYHDQVLTPLKTLFEYDAINITLGLPFTRISPDHGPNEKMLGKNLSNPLSLIKAITFLDKN